MAPKLDNHESFFSFNLMEIAKGFFIFSSWFGNVFINIKDLTTKMEAQT